MVERTSRRSELVARVDPDLCVSCGICAGSCGPMGVGPPGRTGRDQMAATREFVSALGKDAPPAVVIACAYGAGRHAGSTVAGATIVPIDCCGNLHTSVVETMLRAGVGGVLVAACPARDCRNREGPRWIVERMYQSREARLQPRVDRRRVAVVHVEARDLARLEAVVARFIAKLPQVDAAAATGATMEEGLCESALAER
jgi:coenzyme F420-reducing hydrogenase delta subunit